eukprot:scaffold1178_cov252-Pinguiococcus_pyrenoidosus.AAC.45
MFGFRASLVFAAGPSLRWLEIPLLSRHFRSYPGFADFRTPLTRAGRGFQAWRSVRVRISQRA